MGQVQSRLGENYWGVVSVTYGHVNIRKLQSTSDAIAYWTIPFQQESPALEEACRGMYFHSNIFEIAHPFRENEPTKWRLRLYPCGEVGGERGTSVYVERLSTGSGHMIFSVTPLRMGGNRLYELQGRFAADKVVSRDGRAVGLCLGGFRQVLESIKKPDSHVTDVLYITLEFKIRLIF